MDAQGIPSLDLWPYAKNAVQFVISYPYFYLFPVLTITRNAALAASAGSEKLSALVPDRAPNFFTAFIFPLKPFCIWVIEKVLREVLTNFLRGYLGFLTNTMVIILCAPLKLLRTWAMVRSNRSSVRGLINSVHSLSFASWRYYIGTLFACEAVELLILSPAALPLTQLAQLTQTAQDVGIIPQQTDEEASSASPTWILTSFATLIGPIGILILLEWFPSNVVSVRAALSLLDPGYGGGHGLKNDILLSLRSTTPSLCGKLTLYYCVGMIASVGTRAFLGVMNWGFKLVAYLRTLEKAPDTVANDFVS